MKEAYFTFESIKAQAKSFLDNVRHIRAKKEKRVKVNPGSMALLVLDMQRYFLEESSHAYVPSAKAIVPNIKHLQEKFLSRGLQVSQTRHINNKENAIQMKTWWNDLIASDNPYSALIEEIYDTKVFLLEKTQYDAFFGTNLEKWLLEKRDTAGRDNGSNDPSLL